MTNIIIENNTPHTLLETQIETQLEQLRRVSGRKKYQLILESEHSSALVQSIPAQELFLMIKELGVLGVPDLIGMASPEQVTLCVDMDCWQGDELDSDESLQWLHLLLIQDEKAFLRLIDGFDFELLVMMVKKQLTIITGLESLHDDEDLMAERKRFDQVYECEYRNEDVAKIMDYFQDVLFRERQEQFLRLMEAVRHEFDLALQEDVFTQRNGRLQDLGFVDPFEARSLYSFVDPDTFNPDHHLNSTFIYADRSDMPATPAFMLTLAVPQDIIGELLSGGLSYELGYDLSFLLNRALSAEQVDFGEPDHVGQVMEDVYHVLNIALGYLAGSDLDRAETLLNEVYLQTLYQLGFSLMVQQRRRAETIKASAIGSYLDGSDAALINALCQQPKPQFYKGLVDASRADVRSFHCWAEVVRVQSELECIEVLQTLFSAEGLFGLPAPEDLDLCGCIPEQGSEVTLSELFLTALANRLMGRDFLPEPIVATELLELHQKVTLPADGFNQLRQQTQDWLEGLVPGSRIFASFCFDIWEQEFCALEEDEVIPQHVGGLLIRL
ncbi:MAG: DUF6178 family protein [Thermodesulfobacteriota bacterium]|nr:DUF6178 family protein [Thermodesulfobacteriota bacterium]